MTIPRYLMTSCIRCKEPIRVNTGRGYCKECRKRVFGGRLESDALNREYARISELIWRLCKKHPVDEHGYCAADPALSELFKRQDQIIDELEECTGIKIRKTEEEILAENRMIQLERNKLNEKIDTILDDAREEEKTRYENERKQKLQERLQRGNVEGQTKLFGGDSKK